MMTKKDYIAIAKIFDNGNFEPPPKQSYEESGDWEDAYCTTVNMVVFELADYMATDNPAFDREKFISACYATYTP